MQEVNAELVINGRHYRILGIDRSSVAEGWALYQAMDSQTGFGFRVAAFAGSEQVLEAAREKARKLARLRIAGLPLVYDVCLEPERLFIVTDWVKGLTLREYLASRRGPAQSDLAAAVEYGRKLCMVLSQLHPAFVHRGLRPESIIVAENRVLLAELGFSHMPAGFEQEQQAYRAPEQTAAVIGEAVGCWSDIYAFGLIFAEMLTGSCTGCSGSQTGDAGALPGTWAEVPAELKEVVLHCIQNRPGHRPQTIEAVKRRLTEWLLLQKAKAAAVPETALYTGSAAGLAEPAATLTEAARAAATGAGKTAGSVRQRLRRLAGRRGLWLLVAVLLLLSPLLIPRILPSRQPAAPVAAEVVVSTPAGLGPRAEYQLLYAKLQEGDTLLAAYSHAKVRGSPEKTALNYRGVESGVKSLQLSLAGFVVTDRDLAEVLSLELQMADSLGSAAGLFADYLEGKKTTTANMDWVEEADSRYRKAQELRALAAGKLNKLQP